MVDRVRSGAPREHYEQQKAVEVIERYGIPVFAVPNGGRRARREAARLVREGVRSGVPDLQVLARPRIVGLEMKRADGTYADVTDDQRAWLRRYEAAGLWAVVGYGWRDALAKLRAIGVLAAALVCLAAPPAQADAPAWRVCSIPAPVEVALEIHLAAVVADVDPIWMAAVSYTESRWIGRKAGDGGASIGLWQMTGSAVRAVAPWLSWTQARRLLAVPVVRSVLAGLYWRRLIDRYGRRQAPVIYTCGPRCAGMDSTRTARAYERHFRRMRGRQ